MAQISEHAESLASFGPYAFWDCTNMISVIIPNTAFILGSYIFYSCRALTSVLIVTNFKNIGDSQWTNYPGRFY
jgi:hypothetical protein